MHAARAARGVGQADRVVAEHVDDRFIEREDSAWDRLRMHSEQPLQRSAAMSSGSKVVKTTWPRYWARRNMRRGHTALQAGPIGRFRRYRISSAPEEPGRAGAVLRLMNSDTRPQPRWVIRLVGLTVAGLVLAGCSAAAGTMSLDGRQFVSVSVTDNDAPHLLAPGRRSGSLSATATCPRTVAATRWAAATASTATS